MNLLYCRNGIVISHSDDGVNAPPAEVFGTDVRVIPWPHPFGDLTKPGTAPPPDPMTGIVADNRPFNQPTETPEILLGYAAQVRYETSVQGVIFNAASGTLDANTMRLDQGLISNLAAYAQTLAPTDTIAFTQDNVAYTLTAQEAIDLFQQVQAQVQAARQIEADCIADLTSASPTILTYDDVDARFAGTRRAPKDRKFPKKWRVSEPKGQEEV